MLGPSARGFSMPLKLHVRDFASPEIITIDTDLGAVIICNYFIFDLTWERSLTGFGWRLVGGHSRGTCASVDIN